MMIKLNTCFFTFNFQNGTGKKYKVIQDKNFVLDFDKLLIETKKIEDK